MPASRNDTTAPEPQHCFLAKHIIAVVKLLVLVQVFFIASFSSTSHAAHAIALVGEPKYGANFTHFDYVNPQAPKTGELVLALISINSNFDKFNPFSIKGVVAPGVLELLFETLTVNSMDETNTQYGLLADDIQLNEDLTAVTFRLHRDARFSNGEKITADDVIHSFSLLTGQTANPRYRSYFSDVSEVIKIDDQHVRFEFKRAGRDISFIAGSLPVFHKSWSGTAQEFGVLRFELPIVSGPYAIDSFRQGRHITFKRRTDYWGNNIPSQQGSFNFEKVTYKIYKDKDTQVAALRAGDFDFHTESAMRYWCCQYVGKRFDSGELVKQLFPHHNPPAMNGWVANLRRERFRDVRVRQALNYALDFEWINEKIFDNEFKRVTSYFSNTPLAAKGLPSTAELELLEPWRNELPPEVFGPLFTQPNTRVEGLTHEQAIRLNLERALALFAEAGWHFRAGALRNAQGEQFKLEFFDRRVQHPYTSPIYQNLRKLGIEVSVRVTDPATEKALMKNFEFDVRTVNLRESRMPGDELWRQFNSADANRAGSENYAGVNSAAIDHLIKSLMNANTEAEQRTAAQALDRTLLHSHYFIPWRYLTDHYVIHHQRFKQPAILPRYYNATEWATRTWWQE